MAALPSCKTQTGNNKGMSLYKYNPLFAVLSHLNFYPHKVVSRYRDPQLQVGENTMNIC